MSVPERRMTVFPGNSQQTSLTKRPAPDDAESSGRLSASKIPKVPDFHRSQRLHPPALPVKATPHSRLSTQSSRFPKFPREPIGQRSIKCQKGTPWQDHFAILEEEQAGTVTIAHRVEHEHGIVAIRKQECSDGTADKTWARCHHDSVVTLHGTYLDGNTLFFVYDFMEVSLAEALLSPVGKLARYQIAAICQEVLKGIEFIHGQLKIVHGAITADTVMLDRDGNVKLADVGAAMSRAVPSSGNEQQDFRALRRLMVRILEPETNFIDPEALDLKHPNLCDDSTKEFLSKLASSSGSEISKDIFLKQSPGTYCLKPLVLITERSKPRVWKNLWRR